MELVGVELAPESLLGPGVPLQKVMSGFEPREPDPRFDELPADGWRLVSDRPPLEMGQDEDAVTLGRRVAFAAPHEDVPDAWALVALIWREQMWRSSTVEPGPIRVRPGKAQRRAGLRFVWLEDPMTAAVGQPLSVQIGLRNISSEPWSIGDDYEPGVISDSLHAVGWISDLEGKVLPASSTVINSGRGPASGIDPGETVVLDVKVLTKDVEELPPGEYLLTATLTSLNLSSDPARLLLVEPPVA